MERDQTVPTGTVCHSVTVTCLTSRETCHTCRAGIRRGSRGWDAEPAAGEDTVVVMVWEEEDANK